MPQVLCSELIDRAADILQDADNLRWPRADLLAYLNDAQRQIVVHRPDAGAVNASFQCVADSKQTLPVDGMRLLSVVRNVGGDAITKVKRSLLDNSLPGWHEVDATESGVENFVFDPVDPRHFYLFPKPPAGHPIEIIYAKEPDKIVAETDVIGVDDIYANAALDFMLHRAYQKDATYGDPQKAIMYLQAFNAALGIKTQTDAALNQRGGEMPQ